MSRAATITDTRSDDAVNTHAPNNADSATSNVPMSTQDGRRVVGRVTETTDGCGSGASPSAGTPADRSIVRAISNPLVRFVSPCR